MEAADICNVRNRLHLTYTDPDAKCSEVNDRLVFLSCSTGSGL